MVIAGPGGVIVTSPVRPAPRVIARTVFGWTPGIQALVGSRLLQCGCLAGTYRTWRDALVTIVDHRDGRCTNDEHHVDVVLVEQP